MNAGSPSSPLNTRNFTEFSRDDYTVRLQWDAPLSDGGAPVSSYTITRTDISSTSEHTSDLSYTLDIPVEYNTLVTVSIAANNCAGEGPSASVEIYAGVYDKTA